MSYFTKLLAVGAAATALTSVSSAQLLPLDYSSNWQPMQDTASAAFSGPGLFGFVSGDGHYAGFGDSTRRCYGIDSTQGGRNQSTGRYETTWFNSAQGFAPLNTIPGVDIGIVSIQAGTESDIGGDACLSPFFKTTTGNPGHEISAAAILGLQGGTASMGFPTVWESAFQWVGTSVGANTTIGTDATLPGNPLLINLIYEVQGPINGGANNNQYYMASTTEVTGSAVTGPGGVANGNVAMGALLYGASADMTGAFGHSRITANGTTGLLLGPFPFLTTPGDVEVSTHVAFQTPALWATNDGNDGAGGLDWRVAVAPVSLVDLRLMDNVSGGQTNANINWKTTLGTVVPAVAFDPSIVFNQSYFIWSGTACATVQKPMSWDNLGGALAVAVPGSVILGPQVTLREGMQTIPANFDGLMISLLSVSALSLGTKFSGSDDIFLDGTVSDGGGSHSQIWEGMFDPVISGISTLSGGALPILGAPTPSLTGVRLGIAAVGLQVSLPGGALVVTEVANAATVVFQP
jgi:hypothetical protein